MCNFRGGKSRVEDAVEPPFLDLSMTTSRYVEKFMIQTHRPLFSFAVVDIFIDLEWRHQLPGTGTVGPTHLSYLRLVLYLILFLNSWFFAFLQLQSPWLIMMTSLSSPPNIVGGSGPSGWGVTRKDANGRVILWLPNSGKHSLHSLLWGVIHHTYVLYDNYWHKGLFLQGAQQHIICSCDTDRFPMHEAFKLFREGVISAPSWHLHYLGTVPYHCRYAGRVLCSWLDPPRTAFTRAFICIHLCMIS